MRFNGVKVVSFSGVDGAGKTTQIEALIGYLNALGLRYTLHTFWDDVVALSRFRERLSVSVFKGDKGVGSPDNPIVRRDKNVTSWYMVAVRLFLYMLDAFRLCMVVSRSVDGDSEFVIFDRYLYDELANLPLQHWAMRWYVRLLVRLVPKPDIAFLLDADPEAASRRKPEYPLEFVRRNRDAYLKLGRIVGMKILPPLPAAQTAEAIKELVSAVCLGTEANFTSVRLECPVTSDAAKAQGH
jgi:thymidylate kinase